MGRALISRHYCCMSANKSSLFASLTIAVHGRSIRKKECSAKLVDGVNCQHKWDTFGTKGNGHLRACSCFLKAVEYRLRKGDSLGSGDIRQVLAG